jgi:MFS transporter, FHS family, Na+ dependent glucose transporter 1
MDSKPVTQNKNWAQTLVYFAGLASFGILVASWGPVLPFIAEKTGTNLGDMGLVITARAIGVFTFSMFGAHLFDRLPGHRLLGGAMLLIAAVFALVPLVSEFWLLLVMIFVMGLGLGLVSVGSNALLAWVHPENLGPWMNGMNFSNSIGSLLAPVLITAILTITGHIRWAFWILAFLVGSFGIYSLLVPSPAIRKSKSETDTSGRINFGKVWPFALFFVLYVSAEVSFGGWLFTYTITLHPEAVTGAGILTSAFFAAMAVGRLVAVPLSTRLRPRAILLIDLLGAIVSLILILAFPTSLTALWAGTIGYGFFMASIFPTWMTFADNRIQVNGKIAGLFYGAGAIGSMSFPWLCGQIYKASGPRMMIVAMFFVLLAAAAIYAAIRVTSGRKHETSN